MRVLVAEDHPSLGRSVADGLRDEGYAVDLTTDGGEASHMLAVNPYDCVVLDLMLPSKDGWEILRDLRRGNLRKEGDHTPVLCLTARDGVEDRVKGLDLGADDYLVKPFNWDELVARVRALMRRSHGKAETVLRVADLEIDLASRTARRGGQPIYLTAREFALLRYLAMHEGKVVTRADIWEHLYDQNDDNISN
ncbi:MAG: response regulator transcription factor, partial [Tepidisphaeraceae bacterium]